jgi:phosphatidylglycerophosphate synthase
VVVAATLAGKIKTMAQIAAISALIVQHQLGEFSRIAPALLWVALFATVYSGIEYFVRFSPLLVKLWRADQAAVDSGDG